MYRVKDEYGNILEETVNPRWVKQQKRVDLPINADSYEEADGVILSDGNTMVGIAGRNMENYTPLVNIKEVSSDPYIFQRMEQMQSQIDEVHTYQTSETVLKSDLDTAYREGVNSYE